MDLVIPPVSSGFSCRRHFLCRLLYRQSNPNAYFIHIIGTADGFTAGPPNSSVTPAVLLPGRPNRLNADGFAAGPFIFLVHFAASFTLLLSPASTPFLLAFRFYFEDYCDFLLFHIIGTASSFAARPPNLSVTPVLPPSLLFFSSLRSNFYFVHLGGTNAGFTAWPHKASAPPNLPPACFYLPACRRLFLHPASPPRFNCKLNRAGVSFYQ